MHTMLRRSALVLCMLYAGGAAAQDIGRLFTTPEQRNALERQRHAGGRAAAPAAGMAPAAPAAGMAPAAVASGASDAPADMPAEARPPVRAADQVMLVNGVLRRSGGGRETIWVDSVPYSGSERMAGGVALTRGRDKASVALTLRSGKQVSVRAGQRINAVSGRVGETYQAPPAEK